ncbi:O-methyltransferase [Kalaharituber pfeilii]|nr:O-methyltransferase [Kalaharituber pfeilii]
MHSVTELSPNLVTNAVHEYCIQNSLPVAEHVERHRETTMKTWRNVDMMINTLQSQFMMWLIKALGVKEVLEVGCFTGYSALAFAQALKDFPGAEVTTLDLPGLHTTLARHTFSARPPSFSHIPITLLPGPAAAPLTHLSQSHPKRQYDFIFLDANKVRYLSYLRDLGLLFPRGILIADNALKMGLVADQSDRNPAKGGNENVDHIRQAEWLNGFNKAVREDPRIDNVMLPVFDGLNCIRLRNGEGMEMGKPDGDAGV